MSIETKDLEAMDVAVHWMMRLREHTVTEEDITAWMRWYEQTEENRRAFDEVQEFWRFSGELAEGPGAAQRIERLRRSPVEIASRLSNRPRMGVALAACIALVSVLATAWALFNFQRSTVEIAVADVSERNLPDGSQVKLAAGTSVDVDYTDTRRLLTLRGGAAHFVVAQDPSKPFLVQVGALEVRALGTAFNVRKAGECVVVTVDAGAVQVSAQGGRSRRIAAGEEIRWERNAMLPVAVPADVERALAWQQGRLEYIDEPLEAVIADVNRYARHRINIRDEAAGRLSFTGTIFTESTEEWLHALPREFPVRLEVESDGTMLLRAR